MRCTVYCTRTMDASIPMVLVQSKRPIGLRVVAWFLPPTSRALASCSGIWWQLPWSAPLGLKLRSTGVISEDRGPRWTSRGAELMRCLLCGHHQGCSGRASCG